MMNWLKRFWLTPIVLLIGLFLWEMAVIFFQVESWILPSPSAIVREFGQSMEHLEEQVFATLRIAFLGLVTGMIVGVCFASLFHLIPPIKKAFYPFILLSQNIPMIALAPLLVVWFGLGDFPKLLVVAIVCFFPITVSTLDGLAQTDPMLLTYFRMSGASRWQCFIKCEWPSALPAFFSGLKLSATYSVMGAVIAEWLGAERGLGKMMVIASKSYATERLFVAILLVVGLSLSLFSVITVLEKTLWRKYEGSKNET